MEDAAIFAQFQTAYRNAHAQLTMEINIFLLIMEKIKNPGKTD